MSQTPATDPTKATARSPLAGCAILITVGLMVIFLVVFSAVSFFRQADAISKFTQEKPAPVEVTSLVGKEVEIQALSSRLEAFNKQLDGDQPATLALSADDLNLAVAAYQPFTDLRGTFRVREITDKNMRIDVSYKMNGKPRRTKEGENGLITSDFQYLNGSLIARPSLEKNEVSLKIDEVIVPGKAVPEEFVIRLSPYQVMQRYLTDPVMGTVMKKLTRVELANGQLLLKRVPGENQSDAITHEQVDSGSNRLFKVFGIVVSVFLAFVTVMILITIRRAKREIDQAE